MEGYALTKATQFEVVSAYASARTQIPSFDVTPSWQVVGAFFLPLDGAARLDAIGSVSEAGLTVRVRLFDLTTGLPVPGEAVITTTTPTRARGPRVDLTGQRTYQIQAECTGPVGPPRFATIDTVTVSE
jgi:hypothetical protein